MISIRNIKMYVCNASASRRIAGLRLQIATSPLLHHLLCCVTWSLVGSTLSQVTVLATQITLARILSVEGFGQLALLTNTAVMAGNLLALRMGYAATHFISSLRKFPARVGRIIGTCLIGAGLFAACSATLVIVFSPSLVTQFGNSELFAEHTPLLAAMLFLTAVAEVMTGCLAGLEAFKSTARINAATALVGLPLSIWLASTHALPGALLSLVLVRLASCVLTALELRRICNIEGIQIQFTHVPTEARLLITFALPAVLSGTFITPVSWWSIAHLASFPNGYNAVGIYNAALQWQSVLCFLPNIVINATFPAFSFLIYNSDYRTAKKLYKSLFIASGATVGAALLGCVVSSKVMGSYGEDFTPGWPTLCAILLTCPLLVLEKLLTNVVFAACRPWLVPATSAAWSVLFLFALKTLPFGGTAFGLALARALAYLGGCGLLMALTSYLLCQPARQQIDHTSERQAA